MHFEKSERQKIKKRVKFLIEQYAIATELGIVTNKLDTSVLSQNQISLNINSDDVPYYLRGSKAIKKEIELIESRSEEDILLMADGYMKLNKEIAFLQNNQSSSQLKNAAQVIETDNVKDWVEFDIKLADVKSQKKKMLYVALSMVLGGMVGVIYVLISNVIHKRKGKLAKV